MSTSQDRFILAQFPDCPLAPLEGLPNYAYLTEFDSYFYLAIADTGTNGNFFPSSTKCDEIKLALVSLPVKMPNGTIIHSTHTGIIPNDSILLEARRAHLFKELDQALISIGVFCDNGCMGLFDDARVVIFNK